MQDTQVIEEPETGPLRRCILSMESLPKEALLRFVVAPDGRVLPDLAEKLPGRGLWVEARRGAVEAVARKGIFAKAARKAAKADFDLADKVEAQLRQRAMEALHLCRRSGLVVMGAEKIRQALTKGGVALLLHAMDAGADGKEKLNRAAGGVEILEALTREEIEQVTGRENAAHLALKAGGAVTLFRERLRRLTGFNEKTVL